MILIDDILKVKGSLKNFKNTNNKKYNRVSINSLDVKKGEIFFAIKGENNDGHKYIDDVIKRTNPDGWFSGAYKTLWGKHALLKAYMERASESGSKGTLGDVTFESSENYGSIKDLIKTLKDELKKWEDAMRGYHNEGRAKPKATRVGLKASSNSDVALTTVDTILTDFARFQCNKTALLHRHIKQRSAFRQVFLKNQTEFLLLIHSVNFLPDSIPQFWVLYLMNQIIDSCHAFLLLSSSPSSYTGALAGA